MVQEVINDSLQIIESEGGYGDGDQKFSHTILVMKAMRKCLEAGAKEMIAGYFNEKSDARGNTIRIYIEDTRNAFIESIKTLEMVMECDLDADSEEKLKEINEKLKETYDELIVKEFEYWKDLSKNELRKMNNNNLYYQKDTLNINLNFYQEYIEKQVETHRKIFKELNKLTKRMNFYEGYDLEA